MASVLLDPDEFFNRLKAFLKEMLEKTSYEGLGLDIAKLPSHLLLSEKETAQALGLSTRTLQSWRIKSSRLRFRRLNNRAIRYKVADIRQFIEDAGHDSTSDAA